MIVEICIGNVMEKRRKLFGQIEKLVEIFQE
jgi:hypothetical protein